MRQPSADIDRCMFDGCLRLRHDRSISTSNRQMKQVASMHCRQELPLHRGILPEQSNMKATIEIGISNNAQPFEE
jgi:hypothetical protein